MNGCTKRGDEWSLRAFASMPSTAIFLRARAEIKNLLCELASNAKIWGARASEHSFKFCEQLKILMDHSSPLLKEGVAFKRQTTAEDVSPDWSQKQKDFVHRHERCKYVLNK